MGVKLLCNSKAACTEAFPLLVANYLLSPELVALEGQVFEGTATAMQPFSSPSLSTSAYLSAQLFSGEFAAALKMFLEPLCVCKHIFV